MTITYAPKNKRPNHCDEFGNPLAIFVNEEFDRLPRAFSENDLAVPAKFETIEFEFKKDTPVGDAEVYKDRIKCLGFIIDLNGDSSIEPLQKNLIVG